MNKKLTPGQIYNRAKAPMQKARSVVKAAIKKGLITQQPCEICARLKQETVHGCSALVHAHHNDYSKPLEITWLCLSHHFAWHRVFLAEGQIKLSLGQLARRLK